MRRWAVMRSCVLEEQLMLPNCVVNGTTENDFGLRVRSPVFNARLHCKLCDLD